MFQQVRHMFDEIDYVLEGKNAERFAILYSQGEFDILFIQFMIVSNVLYVHIIGMRTTTE